MIVKITWELVCCSVFEQWLGKVVNSVTILASYPAVNSRYNEWSTTGEPCYMEQVDLGSSSQDTNTKEEIISGKDLQSYLLASHFQPGCDSRQFRACCQRRHCASNVLQGREFVQRTQCATKLKTECDRRVIWSRFLYCQSVKHGRVQNIVTVALYVIGVLTVRL